jgi:hypothetical protein
MKSHNRKASLKWQTDVGQFESSRLYFLCFAFVLRNLRRYFFRHLIVGELSFC